VNNIPLTVGDKNVLVPAVNGKNIVLTVDRNIQNAAEKAVQSAIDELHAKHASALVMNPQTGEVLAMANMPNYDPENYGNVEDAAIYQTNATMDAFEPASVCKSRSPASHNNHFQ
jgi:cell division protein FtsI/penicillin-binding protein 2